MPAPVLPQRLERPPTELTRRTWSPSAARATRSTPRSWPAGWRPTAGSWSPTPRTPTSALVNTCGFVEAAKKDSIDTLLAAADLRRRADPGGRRGRLPGRALRRPSSPRRCPRRTRCSASTTTPRSPTGCTTSSPASPPCRTSRATAAPCCPCPRSTGRPPHDDRVPATPDLPDGRSGQRPAAVRRRLDGGPVAPLKLASGLRPAVHVLRHPGLPRRVRLAAARRDPGRGARGWPSRASASSSWSARTPRPTARTSATCGRWRSCCPSWPRSTASSGSGSATCSPPRLRPGLIEVIAGTAGVAALLRPVVPARQRPGAAPDAPVRRPGRFLELLEQRPRGRPDRRRPQQRDRRASPARPRRTSSELSDFLARPGSMRSACSATPTRTAPRRRPWPGKLAAEIESPSASRLADLADELVAQRAEDRIGETCRRAGRGDRRDGGRRGPRRPPGSRGRRLRPGPRASSPPSGSATCSPGPSMRAEGVDLVVEESSRS